MPMVSLPFLDREDAGRQLAVALAHYRGAQPLVLAIPRGAVPIGRIVAEALDGELDVVLVRKLGAPGNPEFAIGAVDEQGAVLLNEDAAQVGASDAYVRQIAQRELALIRARRACYRPGHTLVAALQAVRAQGPARLVCAVPVAASDSLERVAALVDETVCLATPRPFYAVGQYYLEFTGVTDDEVIDLLARSAAPGARASAPASGPV